MEFTFCIFRVFPGGHDMTEGFGSSQGILRSSPEFEEEHGLNDIVEAMLLLIDAMQHSSSVSPKKR